MGSTDAGRAEIPDGPPAARPVFWKEIYWFAVICLGGWMLALAVLPERLARYRASLDMEADLQAAVTGLEGLEDQYKAAIAAVENDPFYREEVVRSVLKVRRKGEVLLSATGYSHDPALGHPTDTAPGHPTDTAPGPQIAPPDPPPGTSRLKPKAIISDN